MEAHWWQQTRTTDLKANPPDDRWRFLFVLERWVTLDSILPEGAEERDNLAQQLLRLRDQAAPYASPVPPFIYRGTDRNLQMRPITSWTKHFAKARWFCGRFQRDGIVLAEHTDDLDVYTYVPNVVKSRRTPEIYHTDFYRARGEAEVLVANYTPSVNTRIVYDTRIKPRDMPSRGLSVAEWQKIG